MPTASWFPVAEPAVTPRPLVWIPRPVHPDALTLLAERSDVVLGYGDSAKDFAAVADRVSGILLRTARVDGDMISAAPNLKIIGRHGVGVDTVDMDAARAAGVTVTTTPTANTTSVAEHVFALLLALRRGIVAADRGETGSDSHRAKLVGSELAGSTLGLVGCGQIASAVATIATHGFGMTVLAFDPALDAAEIRRRGAEPTSLDDLLRRADAVSVHVPLVPTTRGLIGQRELALMKKTAVVLNTARGGIINEDALLAALEAGALGGAGLDVTVEEPLPAEHPLRQRSDVIITPHIAGQTSQALRRVSLQAAASILEVVAPG